MNNKTILRPDYIRLEFNGEPLQYAAADEIISATLTEAFDSSDGISMGSACSSKFTVSLLLPDILTGGRVRVPYADSFLIPYACFADESHEDMPLGKFYVTDVETINNGKAIALECFDSFSKLDIPMSYDSFDKESGADFASVINLIVGDAFEPDDDFITYSSQKIPEFYECTARQMLGYIAGFMGKSASFNRNGNLVFTWYDASVEDESMARVISINEQYSGQKTLYSRDNISIYGIVSGTQNNTLSSGSINLLSFENPFITQEQVNNLAARVQGFSYTPCDIKYRGDLSILPGSSVFVESGNDSFLVCVMEQTFYFNGGFSSEIHCFNPQDQNETFQSNYSPSKIAPKLQRHMQNMVTMKNSILNSKGGVFEILDTDNDGVEDAFILREGSGEGRFILANKDGIAFADNDTFNEKKQLMFGFDGICADAIDTKTLLANLLKVEGNNPLNVFSVETDDKDQIILTIGSANNSCLLKQSNDSFGFYNKDNGTSNLLIHPSSISMGVMTIHFNSFGDILFSTGGK